MGLGKWRGIGTWGDTSGINIEVTEMSSPAIDSSVLNISGALSIIVTEAASPAIDESKVKVPVFISVNARNIIRIKRTNNTVRIK